MLFEMSRSGGQHYLLRNTEDLKQDERNLWKGEASASLPAMEILDGGIETPTK